MPEKLFDIDAFRAQPLPTEDEIMANWQGDIEKPIVSVLCHTFNQAAYIEDAFRGFLIQKTDFVFEVIVHDDASTDGTSDIVREYAKRYPQIFKPVIQAENQYSQGKKPTLLSSAHAKGEYFALCEGDDFWIDENKLQGQFELSSQFKDIQLFYHPSIQFKDEYPEKVINSYYKAVTKETLADVILGGGGYMPTASLFFKRDVLINIPSWFKDAYVGDYYIQCLAAKNGVVYSPCVGAVYRYASSTSVSQKTKCLEASKLVNTINQEIQSLEALNLHYDGELCKEIDNWKSKVVFSKSCILLSHKHYDLYKKYLELSVSLCGFNGRLQRILYLLRFSMPLSYTFFITFTGRW